MYRPHIHLSESQIFKIAAVLVAVGLFVVAGFSLVNSQNFKVQETRNSQSAVAAHTQTLNEIDNAITQLKNSNAADHAQTVKYINCVLVGITGSSTQAEALAVYQECLASSGVTQ